MMPVLRAALVIARRDYSAVIFSKAFIFFIIGPLFPLLIALLASGLSQNMANDELRPVAGVALPAAEAASLEAARERLLAHVPDESLPKVKRYPPGTDEARTLARPGEGVAVMLSGTLAKPRLTGRAGDVGRMERGLSLMVAAARAPGALPDVSFDVRAVKDNSSAVQQARLLTGRGAQVALFLLTMLLAGMVLSNMVEEKTNKIIEILAAAIPIDAIFLGKLMAMLAMSLTGIAVWALLGGGAYLLWVGPHVSLPPPAVGWPAFVLLGIVYFAMAYTLLGSLFIGIGSQASTVREVQTLSMPVTMAQVLIFFFTTATVNKMGSAAEIAAVLFPLSSPFAMIARAAQSDGIGQHVLAIGWQALWVALIIRMGVRLFRRNVLKSGRSKPKRRSARIAKEAAR